LCEYLLISSIQSAEEFSSIIDTLNPFSIILVTAPVDSNILRRFVEFGSAKGVPIFYIHSIGFYARFSILVPHAFPIVDTHPDPATTADLRLLKPWPTLLEYARKKTEALESMDDHAHGHVPYLLLILYYLEKWQKENDGKFPSNYKEKNEFKKFLNAGMRMSSAEGSEENYEQAVAAVLKNLNEPMPNSSVKEVFNSPECTQLTGDSANFWVIAHAISQFYQSQGVLPLPGSVPDMKAISSDYVELQNVYKSKAREDIETVLEIVRTIEQQIGKTTPIEHREIEAFCKGAAHIKLIRGKPFIIASTTTQDIQWGEQAKFAAMLLTDDTSGIQLYIAFTAYDILYQQTHVAPGSQHIDGDAATMTDLANAIVDGLLQQAGKTETDEIMMTKVAIGDICREL
jgi:amyloid beta precursor protein binding protein 1